MIAGRLGSACLCIQRPTTMQSNSVHRHSRSITTSSVDSAAAQALEAYSKKDPARVYIRFKAIGNAPIMKKNLYQISVANPFQAIVRFLRKELNWKQREPLFTYINSSFCPAPDDTVANLYKMFQTDGHLIVNYSTTPAWG